jgi:beta-galactosidase
MDARPSVDMTYADEIRAWHRALWNEGVTCDLVPAAASAATLAAYRLVLVPSQYLMPRDMAAALTSYAEGGGHLIVGAFSGLVDADDRVHPGHYPGALRDLLGLRVDEHLPLGDGVTVALDNGMTGRVWSERVIAEDADTDARFTDGPAAGHPALLCRVIGDGVVRYAAARLDDTSLRRLLSGALADADCAPAAPGAVDGVEAVRRYGEDGASWLFVLNHTADTARVTCHGIELLAGTAVEGTLTVAPGAAAVVREVR